MTSGVTGYENNTDYSVGHHPGESFSASLMISNDRIQLNTANLLLAQRRLATGRIQDMNALTEHAAIAAADARQVLINQTPDITLRDCLIEAESLIEFGAGALHGRSEGLQAHTEWVGFGMERAAPVLLLLPHLDVSAREAELRGFQSSDMHSRISARRGVLS